MDSIAKSNPTIASTVPFDHRLFAQQTADDMLIQMEVRAAHAQMLEDGDNRRILTVEDGGEGGGIKNDIIAIEASVSAGGGDVRNVADLLNEDAFFG